MRGSIYNYMLPSFSVLTKETVTQAQAKGMMEKYKKAFPKISIWLDRVATNQAITPRR